jgi:guanine nucleotide-binding protein subunit gamma
MPTEMRLQRQLEHNRRLREQYDLERIPVSQASAL